MRRSHPPRIRDSLALIALGTLSTQPKTTQGAINIMTMLQSISLLSSFV